MEGSFPSEPKHRKQQGTYGLLVRLFLSSWWNTCRPHHSTQFFKFQLRGMAFQTQQGQPPATIHSQVLLESCSWAGVSLSELVNVKLYTWFIVYTAHVPAWLPNERLKWEAHNPLRFAFLVIEYVRMRWYLFINFAVISNWVCYATFHVIITILIPA